LTFDIIIVGAGTAGCAVAAQLARHTEYTIAVLEAGVGYPAWALHAPLAGLRLRPLWSRRDETVPIAGLLGRSVVFPMGRVVGGTSSVNAMIAAAGAPAAYAFLGKGVATTAGVESLFGELVALGVRMQAPNYRSAFTTAFLDACRASGLATAEPFDGSASETCGAFRLFQRDGHRWSAAHLLREPGCRDRVTVLTRSSVRRIVMRGRRAVGVELLEGRTTRSLAARVGVVLSAGTIHSPCLLQRSGIGPGTLLEESGVPLVVDLPGVGLNLQDHVGVPWVVPSRLPPPGRPSRWVPAAVRYALFRSGVMASNCCEAGCFFGRPGTAPTIEVFTHFQTGKHPRAVEFSTVLLRPESRGTVGIDPADPWGRPRIDPDYLSVPGDLSRLATGLARVRAIVDSDVMRRFGLTPTPTAVDEEWIRRNATTYYHPAGSCRRGDDPEGVVDGRFRVHGTEGLWIADNSVVPQLPGGHTAATALMIGATVGRSLADHR